MLIVRLLSDRTKWCQGTEARDFIGRPVPPKNKDACSWCLLGAIFKCYPPDEQQYLMTRIISLLVERKIGGGGITTFNDGAGYEDVIMLAKELRI